jgi:hypothetical protein
MYLEWIVKCVGQCLHLWLLLLLSNPIESASNTTRCFFGMPRPQNSLGFEVSAGCVSVFCDGAWLQGCQLQGRRIWFVRNRAQVTTRQGKSARHRCRLQPGSTLPLRASMHRATFVSPPAALIQHLPQRRDLQFVSDPALEQPLRPRASRDGLVPGNRRGHAGYQGPRVRRAEAKGRQSWAVLVWCPEQSARAGGAEPGGLGAGGQCCLCTAAGSPLTATTVGQGVIISTRQALSTVSSSDIKAMAVSGQQHGLVVLDSAGQVR